MRTGIAILWVLLSALGQPAMSQLDSLLQVARQSNSDTARVWAWMEIGKLYLQSQPDTAELYLNQALHLAEKAGFERGVAKCRINRAFAFNNQGKYKKSVDDCLVAVPLCRKLYMKKELVAAYNNMGNAWDYMGNRWQAIDAFSNALSELDAAGLPPHFPIVVKNNITRQYANLGLHQKAYDYSLQSYEDAMLLGDSSLVASAVHHLASAALSLGRSEEALSHCRRVERLARQVNDPILLTFALNNIAVITWPETPAQAERDIREALSVAEQSGDLFGKIGSLYVTARFAIWKGRPQEARKLVLEAMDEARKEGMDDEVATAYSLLSDIALATGNMDEYRNMRRRFNFMSDTLMNNQLVVATQELETQYETAQKEQQIVALWQQKELQQLRIRQKNGLIIGLAAAATAMLVLAALLWNVFQSRRKILGQEILIQQQKIKDLEQERQLGFADAVMQGQEKERSRLARDLHDGLGGMLSGIKQAVFSLIGHSPKEAGTAAGLHKIVQDIDQSIHELRHIARNLMPEALVRFGLQDALQDYCDHLQQPDKLHIHFQSFGMTGRLARETEVVLFRIAQELLNNVVRHAGASEVLVQLLRDGHRLSLTVEDNGRGFYTPNLAKVEGVGWFNIRSRVSYLSGNLDLKSAPNEGCSVHIEIPLP